MNGKLKVAVLVAAMCMALAGFTACGGSGSSGSQAQGNAGDGGAEASGVVAMPDMNVVLSGDAAAAAEELRGLPGSETYDGWCYASSQELADLMADGFSKDAVASYAEEHPDSWVLSLQDDEDHYLSVADIEGGAAPEVAQFGWYLFQDEMTSEEVADLMRTAFEYDKGLFYSTSGSDMIEGYATSDNVACNGRFNFEPMHGSAFVSGGVYAYSRQSQSEEVKSRCSSISKYISESASMTNNSYYSDVYVW